ncbi:MAG: SHOCT domain-containing protein [SAR324 cluster bacterium]
MWGWNYGPGWGPMMWGFGWLFPFLFVIVIVFFMFRMGRRMRHRTGGDRALEILRERYARGEIQKQDFDRMKQDLG